MGVFVYTNTNEDRHGNKERNASVMMIKEGHTDTVSNDMESRRYERV